MNTSLFVDPRTLLCALAGGLVISAAAVAQPKDQPPKAQRVEHDDPRVYMIVEDPVVPEGTKVIRPRTQVVEPAPTIIQAPPRKRGLFDHDDDDDEPVRRAVTPAPAQVIEVVPTAPPQAERHTSSDSQSKSKAKPKSRSRSHERGETQYLEVPADPAAPQEQATTTTESSSKMKSHREDPGEDEPPSRKTSTTVRTRSTQHSSDDEESQEVERLQERVKSLEAQVQQTKQEPAAPAPSLPAPVARAGQTVLPVTPLPTTTEVREPLPVPLVPARTTVTENQVTTHRTQDTLPPERHTATEVTVHETNGNAPAQTPPPGATPETAASENATTSFPKIESTPIEDPTVNGPLAGTGVDTKANDRVPSKVKEETKATTDAPSEKTASTEKRSDKPVIDKPAAPKKEAPVAEKTDTEGLVKSPYPPHKTIDVRGMAPGSLAKDPTTQEIFRVP